MNIAIDLLWLRPNGVGGTESYTRNLLDGFMKLSDEYEFTLLVARNTTNTFVKYIEDSRFHILEVNIDNSNIGRRILWQFAHQNHFLRKNGIKHCFVPVYCRPVFNGGVKYINVIHDIQAYHYPEYHPLYEVWYSKLMWRCDQLFSRQIVAISQFVKDDLVKTYHFKEDKVSVIYDPITIDKEDIVDFKLIKDNYDVTEFNYFYTVSQLIPHKNLNTLITAFDKLYKEHPDFNHRLLISGVNGNAAKSLIKQLEDSGLKDRIILTGFVENNVRNTLYKYCKAFLFPSIFEGFGMPPVEAMYMGRPVITTKCASIPEVTQGRAIYVDDPMDVDEWAEAITLVSDDDVAELDYSKFDAVELAQCFMNIIDREFGVCSKQ